MEKLALLGGLSLLVGGCETCLDIGCGAAVTLTVGGDSLPSAASVPYSLEFDLDGHSVTAFCEGEGECEVPRLQYDFDVSAWVEGDVIEVEIYGVDELAPKLIELYVIADGSQVAEATLSPEYRDVRHGDGKCRACRFAMQDYAVPPAGT